MTVHRQPPTVHQDGNASRCYLVTGVGGFIASKVAEQLLEAGHTVVGIDNLNDYYDVRLKYYRLARLAELAGCDANQVASLKDRVSGPQVSGFRSQVSPVKSDRFEFHTLDIEDLPALERVFERSDFSAVFNLAARAGVRYSLEFPELYRRTNVIGEENVLKCQVKYGVKKHVLASSSSVYAGCPMPFVEDVVLGKMQSPYAETKRQAELLALDYHQKHGIDVTVLRYFTVFGPAGRPDMAPFRFIKWIDEGTPITLYGDGTQARDFTYVDDIALGTILAGQLFGGKLAQPKAVGAVLGAEGQAKVAAPNGPEVGRRVPSPPGRGAESVPYRSLGGDGEAKQKAEVSGAEMGSGPKSSAFSFQPSAFIEGGLPPSFEIVNLGGGNNPLSITAMIAMIEKALNELRAPGSQLRAVIQGQPASAADMKETWADITKARRLLGWSPGVSPEQGFKMAVDWHIANRAWIQGIKP